MAHLLNEKLKKGPSRLLAIVVGTVLFLSAFLVSRTMMSEEQASLHYQVSLEASNVREQVQERLQERMRALQRMANRWESSGGTPRHLWEDDAQVYYEDFGGFEAVVWVDSSFQARWIVPQEGNEAFFGFYLGKEERRLQALQTARDTRQPSGTRSIDLASWGKGFHVYVPLYVGERFDGVIAGVFRIGDMLNAFLDHSVLNGYAITIREGGEEIYASPSADGLHEDSLGTTLPLDLLGNSWEMRIWPQPGTVEARSTNLPFVIMVLGVFIALVVGIAIYLAQTARYRALFVAYANRALKIEVSERKRVEAALQKQRDFDRHVLDSMGQGLTIVDKDGRFEYVNPAYANMLGYPPEYILGRSPFEFTYTEDLAVLEQARSRRAAGEKSTYETKLKRADGTPIFAHITGAPRLQGGKHAGSITVVTDLSERKKLEQALRDLATRDELTGLYNRRAFNTILEEEASRHEYHSCPVSLVLLDVDHFKKVNDNYGHQIGDEVLQWIARLVTSNSRSQDRVARFGGEEFAVVLPETCTEEAREVAERLGQMIAETDFVLGQGTKTGPFSTKITVSLGVATLTPGGSLDSLISDADKALYRAKRSGRNKIVQAHTREQVTRTLATVPL